MGFNQHHVKNSTEFVKKLTQLKLQPEYIMVGFDVVSLYTRTPILYTLDLLEPHFDKGIFELFHPTLTSTYFWYQEKYYEQTDGLVKGSPLSTSAVNFFMKNFEEKALNTSPLQPKCFYCYMDDTLLVQQHGSEMLKERKKMLIHSYITFTIETKKDGYLAFLRCPNKTKDRRHAKSQHLQESHPHGHLP